MRTTTLGPDGPQIGVLGLGCMGMSFSYDQATPRDEAELIRVIHDALDLGMTLLDTADVYGPYTNEELLGRALAGGHRERAVLATKVGMVIPIPALPTTPAARGPTAGPTTSGHPSTPASVASAHRPRRPLSAPPGRPRGTARRDLGSHG